MLEYTLYNLWLPITQFSKILKNLNQENIVYSENSNGEWSWINFKHQNSLIVIDSLGYIYIELYKDDNRSEMIRLIEDILNKETKYIIKATFLNPKIQSSNNGLSLLKFIEDITIEVSPYLNLRVENICSQLSIDNIKVCSNNKIKISLDKNIGDIEKSSFYHILNRNFCQLLDKSIYFTHGLDFEDGEIYNCLNLLKPENLKPVIEKVKVSHIKLEINNNLNNKILLSVLRKAIQDTIEEKSILHFLDITKSKYLNKILSKIYITNLSINKLNSYLLATPHQNIIVDNSDFDEEDIEVFVQNLLETIPKFHNIETKIKETYYIKIGNTTTSARVEDEETILKSFFYNNWKASIKYFIDTVDNIKESLHIYHQNKHLKELEDISYNANYQADIEDIRDLKSSENNIFNDKTKNYINLVLTIFAIINLAGEAPIFEWNNNSNIFISMFLNLFQHIVNIFIFYLIFSYIIFPFLEKKFGIKLDLFRPFKKREKNKGVYIFENSDYDKHEHRSNKSIYTTTQDGEKKVTISYNDTISAFSLMKKLKVLKVTKPVVDNLKSFSIFPPILRETPIEVDYLYRESYRISRSDKVTTKIMFRYKVTNMSFNDFLELFKNDDFLEYYKEYLANQNIEDFPKEHLAEILDIKKWDSEELKLNLYIVYSFILKLNRINGNECDYSIVKDQFRVHYHINKFYYKEQQDLAKQQESLGQLIHIYFLARLKKFS